MRTEQFSQLPQPIKKELEVTKFQSSKADPTSPIDSSDTLRIQQRQRHTQQDNLLNQEHFQGNTSVHYIPPSQYFMASENLSLHYNVQNLIAENQQLREYVNYLKQNLQYLFENPHLLKKSDTKLDAKPTKEYLSNSNTQDQAISTSISPLNSAKNIPSSGLSTSMEQLMDNMITYPFTFNHVTYPKSQLSQSVPSNATNSSKFDHATTSAYSKNSSGLDIAFNIAYEENTENLPRRMNTDTDHPQQLNINKQAKTMHAKKIGVASVSKGQQFKPPLSEDGKNYLVTDDGSLSIVMKNDLDSVYSIYNEFMQSLKPQIDSFVQDHGRSKLAKFQKKRTFQKRKAFCSFVETIVNSTSFTSEEILDIIDGIRAQNDHSVIWVCNNLNQLKMDLLKQRPDLAR
ncbi:transcription activator GCR1-like domain-containing protein [Kluyveromyces lactis]|uniref:KLLA0F18997p n=1 Tax=Kluyveromyces lactis (strain ATCC 8585 / CBS 2359 / DSM 70799 / NBRC 1267 / NRRL Y-1140 / WM37) TaxID=284590 RepID=Q6CJF7_KLULA|nr:uncharacterized protein KLLA0_F18997g [Kluyveromyces lactis]CAG98640.1 KLLA0F18997p [Kluyveromyces lactis]|eukprot:XP_455932.1 uncharacterized protein KLLA0_F18997g [Kluyveromyces lactis]